ncbi:MAG: molybdopterin-dependent oxidoreductase, partial [Cocleimonas sp.]
MTSTTTSLTTCPYCGVGCGVQATREQDGKVSIKGDDNHPSNFGRLCSKGSALADTIGLEDRLLHPSIKGKQVSWDIALDTVSNGLKDVIKQHGADAVAFYVSGQLLTEDYYVANK